MRKNNCMLLGFMILPLRALHLQGISTALQDPPGTSSPQECLVLPGHFHHFAYKISHPQPKGSPSDKQPVWAQAHATRCWEPLFPTSNKMNLPPCCLELKIKQKPVAVPSEWPWYERTTFSCKSRDQSHPARAQKPTLQHVGKLRFTYSLYTVVPELLIPGVAVTFGNYIS